MTRGDVIEVRGHVGYWHIIDHTQLRDKDIYLLEHDEYGDEAANIIIDDNKNVLLDDVYNGFADYYEYIEEY